MNLRMYAYQTRFRRRITHSPWVIVSFLLHSRFISSNLNQWPFCLVFHKMRVSMLKAASSPITTGKINLLLVQICKGDAHIKRTVTIAAKIALIKRLSFSSLDYSHELISLLNHLIPIRLIIYILNRVFIYGIDYRIRDICGHNVEKIEISRLWSANKKHNYS